MLIKPHTVALRDDAYYDAINEAMDRRFYGNGPVRSLPIEMAGPAPDETPLPFTTYGKRASALTLKIGVIPMHDRRASGMDVVGKPGKAR